ncbi:MAG TPA: ATP-dependent DNA ligase [Candidatus Babeliales bacterium]|nr:ATP-dependent DNA ligase [Candidatus Babeliales bacterium]
MKFSMVTSFFDEIEKIQSRLRMTEILADLLNKSSEREAEIICNLALGQLNPAHRTLQFNIATAQMMKAIALLLEVPEAAVQERAKQEGDLGLVVAQERWHGDAGLTVVEVDAALRVIATFSGHGSQEQKINAIYSLLKKVDPISAKFIVRIIIGKLRLGFSDMTLIDALSWMTVGDKSARDAIENAYNVCADIGYIARILKQEGMAAVEDMHAHVGIPIRPAAAERLPTARAIIEKIGVSIAQPKLDGFRLQIHINNANADAPDIHFYSRNLTDMSFMFPDLVADLKKLPVTDMIAEGEAIVYDPHTGQFLPFQETVKRKRKHDIEAVMADFPLQLFLFDLLYINGQELLTKTHEERRAALLNLFKDFQSDVIKVIEEKKVETAQELEEYFTANIAAGLEGLVVKKIDSVYRPGKRNFSWIKLKRQEEGHLEDTIDCVILGYYAGEGKRAQFGIGAFLVGIYNAQEDRFETVAKIGTGLKDHDWVELKQKCDANEIAEKPKNVVCAKELYPDVWVDPVIVVMIRADEITISPLHAAGKTAENLGYALRFPRFMGYRLDKSVHEITTDQEIKQLYQNQFA